MMQEAFPGELAGAIQKRLQRASDKEFIKILEGIDFSRYAYGTLRRIAGKSLIVGEMRSHLFPATILLGST